MPITPLSSRTCTSWSSTLRTRARGVMPQPSAVWAMCAMVSRVKMACWPSMKMKSWPHVFAMRAMSPERARRTFMPSATLPAFIISLRGFVRIGVSAKGSSSRGSRDSAKPLVRVDQILLAGGLLAVDGDLVDLERFGERDLLRVGARERGLDLGCDPLPQLLGGLESDLLQEGGEQPASDAPCHAEGAIELGGPAVQSSVDVDLLVRSGPVAAILLRRSGRGHLHGGEDLSRQSSATNRIEGHGGAGGGEPLDQVVHEWRRRRVAHVGGANILQEVDVLGPAHDVHEADLVLDGDLVEHLSQIGSRRRVYERLVTLAAHGLDHAERGEGIDEAVGALGRRGPRRQHQALHGLDAAVLSVHGPPEDRDGLAHQRLRGR